MSKDESVEERGASCIRRRELSALAPGSRPSLRKQNKTARHHAKRHGLAVNSNVAEELTLFIPCIKWCAAARHAQRENAGPIIPQ